jgi:hypothetical protein
MPDHIWVSRIICASKGGQARGQPLQKTRSGRGDPLWSPCLEPKFRVKLRCILEPLPANVTRASTQSRQPRYDAPMQPSLMSSSSTSRRVISSFKQYSEAQKAVDYLSDEKFEVSRIAIIAEELRYVEQVTGRLDSGRAALQGLIRGGMLGSLIGLVVGFLSTAPTLELVIRGAFVGLLFGLSSSLITYWMTGGQRDFSSFSSMQAGRFDVVADDEVADKAAQMLERMR